MKDTIYRQDAIDAMMQLQDEDIEAYGCEIPEGFDGDRAVMALRKLPSAEPVIKCKDCGYWNEGRCDYFSVDERNVEIHTDGDGFCSEAERRTDEAD